MNKRVKITLREIRALGPGDELYDTVVQGFRARRQRSDAVAYCVFYRTADMVQKRYTFGRHGAPWTPEMARREAKRILGDIAKGLDPSAQKQASRNAITVAELCERYFADAASGRLLTRRRAPKKTSTLITDRGRIQRHIVPLLGRRSVASINREDIERFLHDVAEGKTAAKAKTDKRGGLARVTGGRGTATRTTGLLGGIFDYAVRHRMRPDNPVAGVERFADGQRLRRLADAEYGALAAALSKASEAKIWPPALAAARFLAYTGWRSGEALALMWSDVDLARRTATLRDTKTGRSIRPLSHRACDVLSEMTNVGGFVFPGSRGDGGMTGFPKYWARIAKLGEISEEVTPHVLRHSLASIAADLGFSEPTIAALIGHKGRSITSRYVHSADAVLLAAADKIADRISELLGESRSTASVISLRAARRAADG